MSRKPIINGNNILPDLKFESILITKFINLVMINGKKILAENIVYSSLDILSKNTNINQLDSFNNSINNIKPSVEIKSKRIGGSIYQIPVEVKLNRSNSLAMKWIIHFARKDRKSSNMIIRLYNQLFDAFNNKGLAIKKRDEIYKIANSNKAFAYFKI